LQIIRRGSKGTLPRLLTRRRWSDDDFTHALLAWLVRAELLMTTPQHQRLESLDDPMLLIVIAKSCESDLLYSGT
jgi:hypothetical protein